tara:strand:+ start:773 stop:1249 length:477 start_codon:yes stop_codon:yes gene_type:complete
MFSLNQIDLIVYDFDGVMTDNKVTINEEGLESVIVHRGDGMAISLLKAQSYRQLIMTSEKNEVVKHRSKKLGIKAIVGVKDKKKKLSQYCLKEKIELSKVMFVGNDLNDIEAMKIVGYPVAPFDAAKEVKMVAKLITMSSGGNGVIRELMGQFNFVDV